MIENTFVPVSERDRPRDLIVPIANGGSTSRREFLAAGAAWSAMPGSFSATVPVKPLNLLVLGGTSYLGPAIVEYLTDHGHHVTLFNRGKTNPDLFPKLEKIRGDRDPHAPDLSGLRGNRTWDAVIDVWPSDPHTVAATARLLQDRTGRYIFISSVVACKDLTKPGAMETDPLFDDLTDADAWYEYDKAQCERLLPQIYGDRCAICRPPIMNGYRNGSDSMRMWAVRIARGGEVLAPGDGGDPVQFTDVKDVAAFAVIMAERGLSGTFNVVGPRQEKTTFRDLLEDMNRGFGDRARLTWVGEDFLEQSGIRAFRDLAMWIPVRQAHKPGFMQVSAARAISAGLTFRPIQNTAEDEIRWFNANLPRDYEFGRGASNKGFPRERELQLLAAWHAQRGGSR